ncbi:MAG: hypothetical protein HY869_24250 [Chloroflexi bacterium]|nr:hypothetical protein [Chloroflexota bacterium]
MESNPQPTFRQTMTRLIFGEPQGDLFSRVSFLIVTAGIVAFAWGAGPEFRGQWGPLLLGMISPVWAESLAETLPAKLWKLAGGIRILGWVGGLVLMIPFLF